ncbi:hypothetical protein [Burkholderia ubonensis]|uniref:hypothetical protein n=1 Tax=Burkholderia ubonensis TaxID=101571 RepID=UPI0007C73FAC|nr:hypothetical protein [Burkholderia ubonensis]
MDRFETDAMDDLMYEAAEGPARASAHAYDEFDEDGFDEGDYGDEGDDEFLSRVLGGIGNVVAGLAAGGAGFDEYDEGDGFEFADEADEGDEFDAAGEWDGADELDAMDELVADALDAADGDEFFRRLARVARSVGRGIGSAARVVGPLASMIPIPQAQMIGRIANVAGRLLADGADEFEVFDEMIDGLDEDGIDAAAPVLAGMVVRRALPAIARAAPQVRRAAVRSVARAVRTATRRQGPPAARAVARAVRATRRIAQRQRVAPRAAAQIVRRVAQQVARRPQAIRRLARPLVPAARRATPRGQGARTIARTIAPMARRVAATGGRYVPGAAGGGCPHCGVRHLRLRGPVTITITGAR